MRTSLEREFRKENRELKASMEMINQCFEEMNATMKAIQKENADIKAQNACLLSECALLKKQVQANELKIVQLEQYSRNKNLEIKGIPMSQDESLPKILQNIGNAIDEPIVQSDVEVCHRIPTKVSTQSNILVQFCSRSKRDAVLEKARKKRLSTSDVGFAQSAAVYINEHLCFELKKLLGMTIAKKKEKNWRFAWTKDGKIFARKTESSRALRIACVSDLDKID